MNEAVAADWAAANQPPPFEDVDLFELDAGLADAVAACGLAPEGPHAGALHEAGRRAGSGEARELARLANIHPPVLRSHDARGARIDRVEYHPAYHRLMAASVAAGLHSARWEAREPGSGRVVARAAAFYMTAQAETGHLCPITMTHAAGAALGREPDLAGTWLPRIAAHAYDPAEAPASVKAGVTFGMGMTERQGGTDVRANTTAATPLGDGRHRLDGHKWFLSAPMSDAFLVLAQAPGGLSCFLVPRLDEAGRPNGLRLDRLKDKMGNRSNASAEVTVDGAIGRMVGEEGRGVPVILEMAAMTRLDCALASAGLMRAGLAGALHHARHRKAFGQVLDRQPLMRGVLADLAIEAEAAVALAMRVAAAYEDESEAGRAFRRVMTPVAKYWICKRAPTALAEAMEAVGGNGYVEELPFARHYREAPVNSIWEGSGNVMCLDVLRAFLKDRDGFAAVLDAAFGEGKPAAAARDGVLGLLGDETRAEVAARHATERIALHAAQHLLESHAPGFVADAHRTARLAAIPGTFAAGAILDGDVAGRLLARALPG